MPFRHLRLIATVILLTLAAPLARADEPPQVLASIKPLHSLAAAIMAGAGAPVLLMRATASSHTYTLRPSDARAIERAQVIFWIGPGYESFMAKAMQGVARQARVVEIGELPGIRLLPVREGGVWAQHDEAAHAQSGDQDDETDMHLWLDIDNAQAIVWAMTASLTAADPANGALYEANAAHLTERLAELDEELRDVLAPVAGKPYIVFHDAYQYLEQRYGLNPVGSITVTPDRVPGPRRLSELRRAIAERKAVCIFSEPQFTSSLVATVSNGTGLRSGILDALGATTVDGPEGYFTTMRALAGSLASCLGQAR